MKFLKQRPRIPNPDELDIAKDQKQWWERFWRGQNHVAYGGIISGTIGFFLVLFPPSLLWKIAGITLLVVGYGIFIDQLGHLFTN